MTKRKGEAASFAPSVGWVSTALALPAATLAFSLFAGVAPVRAADECGLPVGGVVTCDTTTYTSGPADDIVYSTSTGVIVNVNDPALVIGPLAATGVSAEGDASNTGDVVVNGTAFSSISTSGITSYGLNASNLGAAGAITVTLANGSITTTDEGGYGAYALSANVANAAAATATMSGGAITTSGLNGHGVFVEQRGGGAASTSLTGGVVTTNGDAAIAVYSLISEAANAAAATAIIDGGTVVTNGINADGLRAVTSGTGAATAILVAGTITTTNTTVGLGSGGISASVGNAGSTAAATAEMRGGAITTARGHAILATNDGRGDAVGILSGGRIETTGNGSYGVRTRIAVPWGQGDAITTMTGGTIVTTGNNSHGLNSDNRGAGDAIVTLSSGSIDVSGANSDGILARADNGTFDVNVTAGTIASGTGMGSGIHTAAAAGGTIDVTAGAIVDGSRSGLAIRDGDLNIDGTDEIGGNVVVTTAGTVTGNAVLGLGEDVLNLTGGTYTGTIYGDDAVASAADGNDAFNWTGGALAGGFNGQNGSDTAVVTSSTYDGSQMLDGGDDASSADGWVDVLTLSGLTVTANGGNIVNWEVVNVTNGSKVTVTDLVTETVNSTNSNTTIDGASTVAAVNTCGGSMTIGGTTAADSVKGCVSNDMITVTDSAQVATVVEGAGGADTLSVLGNASVAGGVYGGGAGQDGSAASDGSDLITIATTGTVGLVDGQLGDDTIALYKGTIGTSAFGGDGDDLIVLSGATVTNAVDGGTGDDRLDWTSGTLSSFQGGTGSDTVDISASEYDGTQVLDGGDDTSGTDGFVDVLTLSGLTVTANGADIINWEVAAVSGGELTIADGAWSVGTAGEADTGVYLTDGGNLEALDGLALDGNLSIASGSTFIGTGGGAGIYSVTGNVMNAGIITTQDGAVGDTFTVGGNYAGANGQLLVDVDFGTASSDLLVIEGDVVGSPTAVSVRDVTSGTANGEDVLVVDVTGTTKAGDFALAGGPITSGAFLYNLDLIDGGWYLTTDFSPAAPIYEAYPQALLALNGLPTLQQRVGNRYWRGEDLPGPAETVFCKDASQNFRCAVDGEKADYYAEKGGRGPATVEGQAIWGRIEAAHSHIEPYRSTTDAQYDTDVWKLQAGLDGVLSESENGKLVGGVTAHYGRVFTDVSSVYGDGSLSTDGYGLGANLTWYGENGFYVDGQGQFTWYDSNLNSDRLGRLVKGNDATGYALSIEAGQRIGLSGDWTVTPQAQLVYSSVDFDSFTGPNGELVSLDDGDSLRGRLGLSVERDHVWKGEEGDLRRTHLYGIANVYREFGEGTTVMVSGTSLVSQADRWTGEIGIGGSYNWADDKYAVYGELNAATGLDNFADSYRFTGTLGLRVRW